MQGSNWTNLGTSTVTHYQRKTGHFFHPTADLTIEHNANGSVVAKKTEGLLGESGESIYFAPAPSDDVILSQYAKK